MKGGEGGGCKERESGTERAKVGQIDRGFTHEQYTFSCDQKATKKTLP